MVPFYGWFQLPEGYRATMRRLFTFYNSVPRVSWYSFGWPWKDERLSRSWSHPVVLDTGHQAWESRTLTTRSLLYCEVGYLKVTTIYIYIYIYILYIWLKELSKLWLNRYLQASAYDRGYRRVKSCMPPTK